MYTLNHTYSGKESLKKFISDSELFKKKNILVQIFSGVVDKYFLLSLRDEIKCLLPHSVIIGTTTDGEIVDCEVLSGKVVISFSVFEKTQVKGYFFEKEKSSKELGEKIDCKINDKTKAVIIFADGLTTNGEHLMCGIKKKVKISGGFAGDNYNLDKTYVFNNDAITHNGCVVAMLEGDELLVHNDYNLNWEGIGKVLTVTKAKHNRVYELDNIPVKEVYKKYFGSLADKYLLELGIEFPLVTVREGVKIARAVVNESGDSLLYAGNLYEGEEVQFGYASINDILLQDYEMYKRLEKIPVEGLFIYECMARRRFFSNRVNYEFLPISGVKMSGFFTYGEFFADEGKYFFNQTITLLALSENKNAKIKIREAKIYNKDDFLICQALTNLIKSTSNELKKSTELLKKYAHTDGLTKILNRKGCKKAIENLECTYTMLLIDIDNFKQINDKFGHFIGDRVLEEFTKLIRSHIRKKDIFCRYGGEEFLVILPDTDFEDGIKIAEKIRSMIEESYLAGIKVTVSIGVAEHISEFEETFKKADENLYRAKRGGRNKIAY